MKDSIPNDSVAIIISIIALLVSALGWGVVHILNTKATNADRKNNFQLKIYENLLDRSNTLIKIISTYTTSAMSHTNAMAVVLNDYRSFDDKTDSQESIDTKYSLQVRWLEASHVLAELSFKMQKAIEDYMRYLDMNGTDYSKGTKVYDALFQIKIDAYESADRNRKRWSNHTEMDELTPEKYTKMSKDTKADADVIFEFGMCVNDVLIIIYNKTISSILSKPNKQSLQLEERRFVTMKGIIDNRKSNGS